MPESKQKVRLPKSSVVNKSPELSAMTYGELYINYAAGTGNAFLATKKADDTIAKFPESASVVNALSSKVDKVECEFTFTPNHGSEEAFPKNCTITCNKTTSEIASAVEDGKIVIATSDLNDLLGVSGFCKSYWELTNVFDVEMGDEESNVQLVVFSVEVFSLLGGMVYFQVYGILGEWGTNDVVYSEDLLKLTNLKSVATGGTLNDLDDAVIYNSTSGQVLQYNGSEWVNETLPSIPDVSNFITSASVVNALSAKTSVLKCTEYYSGGIRVDKSISEIIAAYNEGKYVYIESESTDTPLSPLFMIDESTNTVWFGTLNVNESATHNMQDATLYATYYKGTVINGVDSWSANGINYVSLSNYQNVNPSWTSTSGWSQILNKPTKLSDFTNDGVFIDSAVTALKNFATSSDTVTALNGKTNKTINVTYSELVQLKNNSALIPGQSYKISDYLTTTTQNNTSASSVQNIKPIVVAENESYLNHYASDESGKLQIWYDIENNINKYAWADSANGKGVIYRMIDEFGNDCPYDFKNILFKRKLNPNNQNQYDPTNGVDTFVKTFHSTMSNRWFHNNIIKRHVILNPNNPNDYIAALNDIVLIGGTIIDNFFDDCCNNNTLLKSCKNNIFGKYCSNNVLSSSTSNNIFGNYCSNNVVKSSSNIFGNTCTNNTLNSSSRYNTFENECTNNTLGNNCSYNMFGNGCQFNTLGDNSNANTFGNCSTNITFGNGSNQYGTFIENVIIGNGCKYIKLYNSDDANQNNKLQNICIAPGVKGTISNNIEISTISRNLSYTTKVAKNSNGVVKIYNEADLVQ